MTLYVITAADQADIDENRARYTALKAAGQTPKTLPPPTLREAAPLDPASVRHTETVPGDWYYTFTLPQGDTIRILNASGKASVSLLCWNAHDTSERLNHADTVKVQWSTTLRKGRLLLSDMGRVLLSIVEDTSAAHDTVAGPSTAASTAAKFGIANLRNSRDNFILAASKHGLGTRDIPPAVTFFAPVMVDPTGRFGWQEERRQAGDFIDLRAEMDLIIAISNCPHPLDPSAVYASPEVDIIQFCAQPPHPDDLCRTASAEAVRAFENNAFAVTGG